MIKISSVWIVENFIRTGPSSSPSVPSGWTVSGVALPRRSVPNVQQLALEATPPPAPIELAEMLLFVGPEAPVAVDEQMVLEAPIPAAPIEVEELLLVDELPSDDGPRHSPADFELVDEDSNESKLSDDVNYGDYVYTW